MKALIVYDSVYGNTEKIARAIGDALGGDARVLRTGDVNPAAMESLDLLIVGAPTYAGRPTPVMKEFIKNLSKSAVEGVNVAGFDTRLKTKVLGLFGYAAGKIAKSLIKMGGKEIIPAEGFFVNGTEGPLDDSEIERAGKWSKDIAKSI